MIYLFAENRSQALELLNAGRSLADESGAAISLFLASDREKARDYAGYGADDILVLSPLSDDQPLSSHLPVMLDEMKKADPELFLAAATFRGKEIAAALAGLLKAGLCSGCMKIRLNPESKAYEMERLAYGGAAVQKVVCRTRPAMATIPPGVFGPADRKEGREGRVRELPLSPPGTVRIIERKAKEKEAKDISEARIVVCPGRGVEKKEDIGMVRELADLLGGEIGCTRPLSEELHWLPEELCIGLSGVSVKPELYLGIGVSGQIQHVTGIRGSKVIAAINKDEHAPIFDAADLGVVGDLYDVVPKLITALKKARD